MNSIIILTTLAVLVAGTFAIGDSFATHFSEDTKWQLVYITDTPSCSNYDYQMAVKYDEITDKYFDLYQFENTKYEPLCMNHYKYDAVYDMPEDLDLLVLVYSKNLGEVELHSQKMGGLFMHSGFDKKFNNAIILCDCPNFYYSDPVWILTHELSHFILYFLEFDIHVIEDLVHKYDEKYDQCREYHDESCSSIMTKIYVEPMAYSFSVMPPYEDAIGISKLKNNNVEVSKPLAELGKIMTKWWASGKISEGDYSNALGLLAVQHQEMQQEKYSVLYKDGPIKDDVTWQDLLLADGSDENKVDVMSKVKQKMKLDRQNFQKIDFSGLPFWFKNTAQYWADDKISDEEFIRSVKYLKDAGIIREHSLDD
ncbi:hypothetical protein NsoK4_00495 [Nitrosopumilus sp. K4]|uniref:hypothetical protein n=1 Tax=Nitrosopumilus sp. K4 TaxID=2795383 RepID=UPI001BAB06D0|nr:hypothetical protein [Nitrosopumilus sp. K4]QUC64803.1 hypothetical protein NsoK4_00495 [Nitrosopumilus sp. K4]